MRVNPQGGGTEGQPGAGTISIIFLLFGVVWTLGVGILDPALNPGIFTWNTWAFIVIAAGLIYLLVRHYTGRLSGSENLYRTIVENAGSIILAMDRDGNITFFNRQAEEFFGFPRGEIIGKNAIGTIVPATESSGRDLDQLLRELCSSPGQFRVNVNENVTSSGKRVWVTWTNRALCDRTGFPVGVVSVGMESPH